MHKISARRSQWVEPIHPASLELAFYDICAHCSQASLWSLENRDVLSQQCNVKGHVQERACQLRTPCYHLTERDTKHPLVHQAKTSVALSTRRG